MPQLPDTPNDVERILIVDRPRIQSELFLLRWAFYAVIRNHMQLEPINESVTRRLRLLMQRRIGWYLLACALLMSVCGVLHYWALDQGIEIAPVIAFMMAFVPAAFVALSIPALEWLYRDVQVRLTQSFYVKRYDAPTLGEVGRLPHDLDRPPRSSRGG